MSNLLAEDLNHILDRTADLWDEVRGQRIFVTGGTGFVGRWLLEAFAWANARLKLRAAAVVLTRNPAGFQQVAPHLAFDPAITLQPGEITDFGALDGTFSHVIHAAAELAARDRGRDAERIFHSIVRGTEHTLAFAVTHNVKRFLMVSSGAVYGPQPAKVSTLTEEYRGAPDMLRVASTYGEGKRAAELLCAIYAHKYPIEPTIARGFAFFGPNLALNGSYAIGNFVRDGLGGGPLLVNGDGSPLRSYLYAADMAIWLWVILLRGKSCRPYNVGSNRVMSIADVAHAVASLWEPALEVAIARQPSTLTAVERYIPSVARIYAELGLAQTIEFQDGLIRWIRYIQG